MFDSLGKVLLLIEVRQLKVEEYGQSYLFNESKKVIDVVCMPVLKLWMDKDPWYALRFEMSSYFSQEDAVSHFVFHRYDWTEFFVDARLKPLLGLSTVTEVFIGL